MPTARTLSVMGRTSTSAVLTPMVWRRAESTKITPDSISSWVTGVSSMEQMGQIPGSELLTEGCMAQL